MKTDTHRIALCGDTDIVETRDSRGDWAIHGKRGSWVVTHVPTGLSGHRATRLRDAQFWMRGAASVHVDPPEGGWVFGRHPKGEDIERMRACDEAGRQELDKARAPGNEPQKFDPDAVPHLCAHRGLVAQQMFCRCGSILDCRRSVSIDSTALCSKCADKVAARVGRPWPALTARITDGRVFDDATWRLADAMFG